MEQYQQVRMLATTHRALKAASERLGRPMTEMMQDLVDVGLSRVETLYEEEARLRERFAQAQESAG
jgi:predicted DNA-binding protein